MIQLRYVALILIVLVAGTAATATAQPGVPEFSLSSSAESRFGDRLLFELEADVGAPVARVTLLVSAPELERTLIAEFSPEESASLQSGAPLRILHEIPMDELALAPFTTLTYEWLIEGADGTQWQSEPGTVVYVDDRFQWRRLADQGVEVYWTDADAQLGQAALDIILESLPAIQQMIPANPPVPLRVYLYPSAADLRAALSVAGRPWVGGHAEPSLGAIFVTAVNPRTAPLDLQRTLPHELTHLLLYQLSPEKYDLLPFWLNEGLSTLFEQAPNPNYELLLSEAVAQDGTIPLQELCRPTLREGYDPALAYAQSASVVTYLRRTYGDAALRGFMAVQLNNIDERRQRLNCDVPLLEAFGFTLEGLDEQWLADRAPRTWWQRIGERYSLWLLLVGLGFVALIPVLSGPRRRERNKDGAR